MCGDDNKVPVFLAGFDSDPDFDNDFDLETRGLSIIDNRNKEFPIPTRREIFNMVRLRRSL